MSGGYVFLNVFRDKQKKNYYFMSPHYQMIFSVFLVGNTYVIDISYKDNEGIFHTQFSLIFNQKRLCVALNEHSDQGKADRLDVESYNLHYPFEVKSLENKLFTKFDIWLGEKCIPAGYAEDIKHIILSSL